MKRSRFLSILLAMSLAAGMLPTALSSANEKTATVSEVETQVQTVPLSVKEALPAGNLLEGGDFNDISCVGNWNSNTQTITYMEDANGGYIECSGIVQNYRGFIYKPAKSIPAGKYRFTGYVRCAVPGEITILRLNFYHGSNNTIFWMYPTSEEWLKMDFYVETSGPLSQIVISGGTSPILVQDYCVDNFALVPVSSIPSNAPTSVGKEHTYDEVTAAALAAAPTYPMYDHAAESEKYEVQGIMINQDADGFINSVGQYGCSEQDLVDFALQFKDTHVTDYVMQLCNTLATFPSKTNESLLDNYYIKDENGKVIGTSTYTGSVGAHHIYENLDTDYVGVWTDILRENGINPWISFRMNDAHGRNDTTSDLMSDFYYENPQFRRAPDDKGVNKYYRNCYDYSHKEIRDNMLAMIDEALYRYNVYGIELDWQREMFLFGIGKEAEGMVILNQFMRDVKATVAKYEEKYGHEIKIGVRVASDVQTNMNFGLDVMTWVKEDIVDMVCPSGRHATADNGTPVAEWKALLEGHDVILASCIENNIQSHPDAGTATQTFETYCASAAMFLSEGADRVYLYNYFRRIDSMITDADRITTDSNKLPIASPKQYHNIITTIGSLDKLMERNRKLIVTYNDLKSPTEAAEAQLPQMAFPMPGKSVNIVQATGEIPEGAKVTYKFSLPNVKYAEKQAPVLMINGEACTFEKIEYSSLGITNRPIYCYDVPVSLHDDGTFEAKITHTDYIEVDYAEIYIEAAK